MKYTIADLRNGKCAVINDGTLEELREVLEKAFPDDKGLFGKYDYYYSLSKTEFISAITIHLPTQSVKDFLNQEWKPKRGEMVSVKNWGCEWAEKIFVTEIEGAEHPYICVWDGDEENFKNNKRFGIVTYKEIKQIPQKEHNVKEYTIKQLTEILGHDIKIIKGE